MQPRFNTSKLTSGRRKGVTFQTKKIQPALFISSFACVLSSIWWHMFIIHVWLAGAVCRYKALACNGDGVRRRCRRDEDANRLKG